MTERTKIMNKEFKGVYAVAVTPFHKDGSLILRLLKSIWII